LDYYFTTGGVTPVSLALRMFKARKSMQEYTLAQTDPGVGVGVTAAMADANVTTAVMIVNHEVPCSDAIMSVIYFVFVYTNLND